MTGEPKQTKDLPKAILSFQPDVVELEHSPLPGGARWVLYSVFAFLILAVIWATWAKVERAVTAIGRIVVTDTHIQIQPITTSVIQKVHVSVGELVEKGQLLVSLDPTRVEADLDSVEQRLLSLRSRMHRLEAEEAGVEYQPTEDEIPEAISLQRSLHAQRREEFEARIHQFEAQYQSIQASLDNNSTRQAHLQERQDMLQDLEESYSALWKKSNVTQNQYIEVAERRMTVTAELDGILGENRRLQTDMLENREAIRAFRANWGRELISELDEVRDRYLVTLQEYHKAAQQNDLATLTAPAAGIVLEVGEFVPGSVVREAEPILKLVPANSELEVLADVPAKDIGFIQEGDPVTIKLAAFPFQRHGSLKGVVRVISEDVFQNQGEGRSQALNYRVRVEITERNLRDVPVGFRFIPGMEATAEIRVGERRIIEYLIYPVIRVVGESMREP